MGATSNGQTSANDSQAISGAIFSALVRANVDSSTAAKYALVAQSVYVHIQSNPKLQAALVAYQKYKYGKATLDLWQGSQTAIQANRLMTNAGNLGLVTDGFRDVRAASAVTALSASVTLIDAIAQKNGVELNPCAISISKVSLDFAGALGGSATAYTGIGLVIAVMSIYAVGTDSYSLGVRCIDPAIRAVTQK